jgi:hypothetical protein
MDKTTDSLKNLILPEELLERIARLENQNAQLHMQNAEL